MQDISVCESVRRVLVLASGNQHHIGIAAHGVEQHGSVCSTRTRLATPASFVTLWPWGDLCPGAAADTASRYAGTGHHSTRSAERRSCHSEDMPFGGRGATRQGGAPWHFITPYPVLIPDAQKRKAKSSIPSRSRCGKWAGGFLSGLEGSAKS